MDSWDRWLTPLKDLYEIIAPIGEGAYGTVYKGKSIQTGELVAIKRINRKNILITEGFPLLSIREISILKSVRHQNIVNLLDVVTDRNHDVYLVFDYAEYDLDDILKSTELSVNQAKSYMRQLLLGLYVLHVKNIIHRDLKPKNILVKTSNIIEIADFGLAKQIYPEEREMRKKPMTPTVITLHYRPLELFFKVPTYGPEVDIWSLGCIFYEMITQKPLFYSKDIKNGNDVATNEMFIILRIFSICGFPTEEDWPGWKDLSEKSELFQSMKDSIKDFQTNGNLDSYLTEHLPPKFMGVKPLLLQMLQLNPAKRSSIEKLLTNEYLHNIDNSLDFDQLPRLTKKEKHQPDSQIKHYQQISTAGLPPKKPLPPKP